MPTPKTLEELAARAEITVADFEDLSEEEFEEFLLAPELGVSVKARVELQKQHADLLLEKKKEAEQQQAAADAAAAAEAAAEASAGASAPGVLPGSVPEPEPEPEVGEGAEDMDGEVAAAVEALIAALENENSTAQPEPEPEPARERKSCAASLAGLSASLRKARDRYVEQSKVWRQRKKDEMTICIMSCCHYYCCFQSQEARQEWVASQARLAMAREAALKAEEEEYYTDSESESEVGTLTLT